MNVVFKEVQIFSFLHTHLAQIHRVIWCIVYQTFLLTDPFWLWKITTYPHILADVSDKYPKLKICISELILDIYKYEFVIISNKMSKFKAASTEMYLQIPWKLVTNPLGSAEHTLGTTDLMWSWEYMWKQEKLYVWGFICFSTLRNNSCIVNTALWVQSNSICSSNIFIY